MKFHEMGEPETKSEKISFLSRIFLFDLIGLNQRNTRETQKYGKRIKIQLN